MQVKFYLSDLHACGHIRGEIVAREINSQMDTIRMDCKNTIFMSDFPKTDLMVFQRAHHPKVFEKMKVAQSQKVKTIYEMDDDLLHMPEGFDKPYHFYRQPGVRLQICDFLENADAITVTTETLKNSIEPLVINKPIYVIENALDVAMWDEDYGERQKRKGDIVTIGWMASGSHMIDVPVVKDAIRIIMEDYPQVRCHFVGWIGFEEIPLDDFSDRVKVDGWVQIAHLSEAMMDFDISLAPLIDCKFNRCKSNIKYLQAAALGVPTVASNIEPYSKSIVHGENGFLVDNEDPAAWVACLSELIENKELRDRTGLRAREHLLDKYDIRKNFVQWANVFERIVQK